jgi:hypothetical protein
MLLPKLRDIRFVDDEIHTGSSWHQGFDDLQEELAAHRKTATSELG